MRSQRRLRLYVVVVVVFLLSLAYFTTDSGGGIQKHHFYKSTVTAIDNAHAEPVKKNNDVKDRGHIQKLDFENNGGARKPNALNNDNKQERIAVGSNKIDDDTDLGGKSGGGGTKVPVSKEKEVQASFSGGEPGVSKPLASASVSVAAPDHEHGHDALSQEEQEKQKEQEASTELDWILKKSPVIVFSKSYCPFSKKAKHILSQYSIVPAPYIVELDQHPLGPQIQKLLGQTTGRRTVPNVMVNGVSIGGGDDMEAFDMGGTLISKIKSIAGKNVVEIKHLPKNEEV